MILEQRNLKVNDELEVHKKQEEKMQRNINKLQNQLVLYTEMLNKKKGSKHTLDERNSLLQNEFLMKLNVSLFEISRCPFPYIINFLVFLNVLSASMFLTIKSYFTIVIDLICILNYKLRLH